MPENQLYAGAGTARIGFPVELFPLEGFSGEIHDAPAVRVLLLEQGERAAIVAAELVMLLPSGVACVKETVAAATGTKPENIWVHTTHAVSTPHEPHAPWGGPKKELSEAERGRIARGSALYLAALRAAVQTAAEAAPSARRGSASTRRNAGSMSAARWKRPSDAGPALPPKGIPTTRRRFFALRTTAAVCSRAWFASA